MWFFMWGISKSQLFFQYPKARANLTHEYSQTTTNHTQRFTNLFISVRRSTFQAQGSVHHNSILIQIQLDATVCSLIYFTAKSPYMFRVPVPEIAGSF